jgi:S-DNA-T family DNA segregation ATPase FtsK/SpoIIIE
MSERTTAKKSLPPAPNGPRLDAVASIALAAGVAVLAAVLSSEPLTGRSVGGTVWGELGATVAAPAVLSLGYASVVGCIGWFALTSLYVRRRKWPQYLGRGLGWLTLTPATAVSADYALAQAGGPYGAGGSIGAYLRFTLDDRLAGPWARVGMVTAVATLGLALALPAVINAGARAVVKLASGLVKGNRIIESVNGWAWAKLARLRTRAAQPAEHIVPLSSVSDPTGPPITRLKIADLAESEPDLGLPEEADEPGANDSADIPIHSHIKPLPPAELKVVSDVEDDAPAESQPYDLPALMLLDDPDPFPVQDHESALRERAGLLEKTFTDFGLAVRVVGIHTGPVITQYEVALETGLRLNKVTALADDLALNLKVASVRVVAPLPGRNTVGIEVPNEHRQTVRLKELIVATAAKTAKCKLPLFVGKDVEGRPLAYDLAGMPHLLIAGRTGTGKSVCLNSIILSLLYTRTPDECRMILIDPKKVELSEYGKIPHLMHPVVTDDRKAEAILAWAVDKMEERYEWLRKARVRNVASYNELGWDELVRRIDPQNEDERKAIPRTMPYVVIIVDEVGDLIMRNKKEIEGNIILIAQKSRAAGIHLILATQKPTVDVITGLIKSNLPSRICFQVASRSDSAVVLDEKGADKLLGMGDMLFLQPGTSSIIRAQGTYVSDAEIEKTVEDLECDAPNFEAELLNLKAKESTGEGGGGGGNLRDRDAMYEQAVEIVVREQRGSTSLLQRALGIGYGRASRLIDFMAEDGLVGGFNGSNARDVLVTPEQWQGRKQAG